MSGYCVYKHTSPSGKVYIGITKYNPVRRWGKNGSGYKNNEHFWRAICKYGWDSFSHEIVASMISKEEACKTERALIAKYKSNDRDHGYNITAGGEVNILPESSLEKIRAKNKNAVFSEEHKKHISEGRRKFALEHPEAMAKRKGYKMTEEQKKNLCEASRKARSKKIECVETGVIYSSMTEACRLTGANLSSLSEMLHGKQKSVAGYTWRYAEVVI